MPTIAYTSSGPLIFVSMSTPASFFPPTTRSFGHFTSDWTPYTSSIPFRRALANKNWRSDIRSTGILGLIISENQRPPLGDFQVRPDRPLPCVWTSDTTTVDSAAPFSARVFALVLVDEILLYLLIFRPQPRVIGVGVPVLGVIRQTWLENWVLHRFSRSGQPFLVLVVVGWTIESDAGRAKFQG